LVRADSKTPERCFSAIEIICSPTPATTPLKAGFRRIIDHNTWKAEGMSAVSPSFRVRSTVSQSPWARKRRTVNKLRCRLRLCAEST
jgi:hypothetical protein